MIPQKQREKCTPLSFGVFFCPFSDKPAHFYIWNYIRCSFGSPAVFDTLHRSGLGKRDSGKCAA